MTWSELTHALTTVARHASAQGIAPDVVDSLRQLRMIEGSEGSDEGVTLTDCGRRWYHRAVIDRENDRLLAQWGGLFGRMFREGGPL